MTIFIRVNPPMFHCRSIFAINAIDVAAAASQMQFDQTKMLKRINNLLKNFTQPSDERMKRMYMPEAIWWFLQWFNMVASFYSVLRYTFSVSPLAFLIRFVENGSPSRYIYTFSLVCFEHFDLLLWKQSPIQCYYIVVRLFIRSHCDVVHNNVDAAAIRTRFFHLFDCSSFYLESFSSENCAWKTLNHKRGKKKIAVSFAINSKWILQSI